jgi:hypothetical protein
VPENFTYLKNSDNLLAQALVSATTADSNYPISNIESLPISKPYRTGDGKIIDQKIHIDFAVAQAVDFIGIVAHNLTSGATITLRGGSSHDPDGSAFNTTLTWASRLTWKILSAAQTYKNWSIEFDDESNSDGYLSFGYIMLGSKTALDLQFQPEWTRRRNKVVRMVLNENHNPMVGRKISEGYLVTVTFLGMDSTQRDAIDTLLDSLDRVVDPVLFVPTPDETRAYFGRLLEDFEIAQATGQAGIPVLSFITDGDGTTVDPQPPFHFEP